MPCTPCTSGTPREERYDRVVRIAQEVFGVKAAAVNFIDADRQFTKAEAGFDGLVHATRTDSLCAHCRLGRPTDHY